MSNTDEPTLGQRAADYVARIVGGWPFILWQTGLLILWIVLNVFPGMEHWDVYPFVFLNLMLSFQAAYTGPIVMISQNRQEELQRQTVEDIRNVGRATLAIAEAQRDMLTDHTNILKALHSHDMQVLETLRSLVDELKEASNAD